LFNMDLKPLMETFYSSSSNSALLLHKVKNPSQYGVAAIENEQIIRLVEKPKEHISDYIITGVYIFDKTIFPSIDNIVPSPRGELEITDAIQNSIDLGRKVTYTLVQGWWKDTGKLSDMLEANHLTLDDMTGRSDAPAGCNCTSSAKNFISPSAVIKDSII